MEMKKNFFPNKILQTFGLLFISLLLTSPIIFLENLLPNEIWLTTVFVVFYSVIIGITYLINKRRRLPLSVQSNSNSIRFLPLMLLSVFIFQTGIFKSVNYIISYLFGIDIPLINPVDTLIIFLGAIILGPIFEEIVFRGIILRGFISTYSSKKAIIYSALMFGIIHGKPFQIWGAIILGLFFGWIYYKTKNIRLCILLHIVANVSIFSQSYIYYNFLGSNPNIFINIWILIISLFLMFFLFKRLLRKMKPINVDHGEQYNKKKISV